MINGNTVFLSHIKSSDLNLILTWRNNPKLRKYFREVKEINSYEQKKWLKKVSQKDADEVFFGIRKKNSDDLLGVCGLNYINWINRNCQFSLYIGIETLYIDKNGWADEATKLLINYGFKTLNLNKIFVEVYEYDTQKIDLLKINKFKIEGALKEHIFKNGQYYTSYIYSLLSKD